MSGRGDESLFLAGLEEARASRFDVDWAPRALPIDRAGFLGSASPGVIDQQFLACSRDEDLADWLGASLVLRRWKLPLLIEEPLP